MEFLKSKFKRKDMRKVQGNRGNIKGEKSNEVFREIMQYSIQAEQAYKKGDMKTAKELCVKAISLNRKLEKIKTPTPYERMAVILGKQNKLKEALEYINEYLKYEPDNKKFLKYREKFTQKLTTRDKG